PEAVKGELYGEKADVWAAGCILYKMATLNPAFYSTNMLFVATKIVGAVYEPVPGGLYSEKKQVRRKCSFCSCSTPDGEACPDIVEVSTLLSDMMKYMDVLPTSHLVWEKKLDQERRQTQQYSMQANQSAVTYHHQLSILSQVSICISSSGAASFDSCQCAHGKDEERTYEAILVEDDRTVEKGIFSQLDSEIDIVDNSSSSSSSNLKESAIGIIKQSFSASERQPQIRKVHQISDPVQQILIQLHKIIFITQLPPALRCNLKRRIIGRFKKSLQSAENVWPTIYYFSPELTEPNIFTADEVHLSSGGNMLLPDDREGKQSIINFCSGIYISNKVFPGSETFFIMCFFGQWA
uniref:Protein kinase domain-containing protein n=1 Tax=Catharus ustulatus TaxID=91951 RepID=A0A8C3U3P7_CATUS